MLTRRRLLQLTGFGGLSLGPLSLFGCSDESVRPVGPAPKSLPDDPSKPWWLRKNFAPVEESEAASLEIEGALPPSLRGLYLRNGPNPMHSDSIHWFMGDGMVHGVRLEGGKAPWYKARYVQTDVLGLRADEVGPPGPTAHQANTSILAYQNKLFCLEEVGLPYEVSAHDLSTAGAYDFAGALATAMTAHPKVDRETGELFFFGYGLLEKSMTYHRTDSSGLLVASEKIALPAAVMMHDFQLTATHVIFMDLPVLFDLEMAIEGDSFPFAWKPNNGARIGVMPRYGTAEDVVWIEIEPCYVFHTWNAFHDPADPNTIHLDAIRYDTMWKDGPSDFSQSGTPVRFTIDLTKKTVKFAPFEELALELPRIHPGKQGAPYRYGYGAIFGGASDSELAIPAVTGIAKLDRQTGKTQTLELDEGQSPHEPLFIPEPGGTSEDDGWLLCYVFDRADNRSHLLVADAADMTVEARVKLPVRVPFGFHADFLSD